MRISEYSTTCLKPVRMKYGYFNYCRKSSEAEDRQAASIDDQLSVNRETIKLQNLPIIREFTESKSAKAPGREQFNEMVHLLETGEYQGIVCWKLNRLFRNSKDEGTIRWLLESKTIEAIYTPHKVYREADSDFVMATEGAQASKFIKDLREDTMRGTQKKIVSGRAPIKAPFGYRNCKEKLQGQRDIEPDDTFPLMRKVFDLALSGKFTLKELWERANDMGIKVSHSQMHTLLHQPFYTGRFLYNGVLYLGAHTPMLTDAEYDLLQTMFEIKAKPRIEDKAKSYSAMIKCVCGKWMTGERHIRKYKNGKVQTFIYYRCFSKSPQCPRSFISLDKLEKQMAAYLSSITIKEKYITLFLEYMSHKNKQQREVREAFQKTLQRQHTEVNQKIENLTEAFISPANKDRGIISDDEMKLKKASLLVEKDRLSRQLVSADNHIDHWSDLVIKTFQFATSAKRRFETGSIDTKRTIMQLFGTHLIVNGKQLDLTIREPFEQYQRCVTQNPVLQTYDEGYSAPAIGIKQDSANIDSVLYPLANHTQTYFITHHREAEYFSRLFQQL